MGIYASPNVYLALGGKRYDASLMIDAQGQLLFKADGKEQLILLDVPLADADAERAARPWLTL